MARLDRISPDRLNGMIDLDYQFATSRGEALMFMAAFYLLGAASMFALYPVLMGFRPRERSS